MKIMLDYIRKGLYTPLQPIRWARSFCVLLLAVSVPADAGYLFVNIGGGQNTNLTGASIEWDDAGGIGCSISAGYVTPITQNLYFEAGWYHYSQCDVGPPWNDTDESSLDSLLLSLEYRVQI